MPVQEQKMEHTSVAFPEQQLKKVDKLVEVGEYPNRSEAIRAAVRKLTEAVPA